MSTPIDIRITPSLHSEILKEIDGYDETTHPLIQPVIEVFDDTYITLGQLHDARKAASRNQAWSEGQQVLIVSEAIEKQQNRLTKKLDNVSAQLKKQIAHFEKELSTPLEVKASVGIAGEIRKFVKEMSFEDRHQFILQAITNSDHTTISAVIGAPAYLSGLDNKLAEAFTRQWHEHASPQIAKNLKAVRNAKTILDQRSGLLFTESEKALGASWSKVIELRQGNNKALAALKLTNT